MFCSFRSSTNLTRKKIHKFDQQKVHSEEVASCNYLERHLYGQAFFSQFSKPETYLFTFFRKACLDGVVKKKC